METSKSWTELWFDSKEAGSEWRKTTVGTEMVAVFVYQAR